MNNQQQKKTEDNNTTEQYNITTDTSANTKTVNEDKPKNDNDDKAAPAEQKVEDNGVESVKKGTVIDKPIIIDTQTYGITDISIKKPIGATETGLAELTRESLNALNHDTGKMVRLTKTPYNFYNIKKFLLEGEDGLKNTFPDDGAQVIGFEKYMKYATSSFDAYSHAGLLAIKFNDFKYPFSIDPTDPKLISDVSSAFATIMNSTIRIPSTGDISETVVSDESIVELLGALFYILVGCVKSYGNMFYIGDTIPEAYKGSLGQMMASTDVSIFNDISEEVGAEENLFIGRLDEPAKVIPILSGTKGYIPRTNVDYQHNLPLLSARFPSEEIRAVFEAVFPVARPFGTINETAVSVQSRKIKECMILNSDIVASTLMRNYANYIVERTVNIDDYLDLVNSMVMRREDFVNQDASSLYNFQAFTNIPYAGHDDVEDLSFFPFNVEHTMTFDYGRKFPPLLAAEFGSTYTYISDYLRTVPFISFQESIRDLSHISIIGTNQSVTNVITNIANSIDDASPELLSEYIALDLMSPFVLIESQPVKYPPGYNKVNFTIDLLGLIVEKHMFYNLYTRNPAQWAYKCHCFLLCYFKDDYSRIFNEHKFGRYVNADGRPQLITMMQAVSKLTFPNVNWTLSRTHAELNIAPATMIARTIDFLRLNQNNVCVDYIVESAYRIRRRAVRIPGACYIVSNTGISYPIEIVLRDAARLGSAYRQNLAPEMKSLASANEYIFSGIYNATSSFGAWYHCIFCPTYLRAAKSPLLTIPDNEDMIMNEEMFIAKDAILVDEPRFPYSVPNMNGVRIKLPSVNSVIFGDRMSRMIKGTLLTATISIAAHNGMSMNQNARDIDMAKFAYLYANANLGTCIDNYYQQLVRRQQASEVEYLAAMMSIGRIPLEDNIRQTLTNASLMTGVTASSFAILRDMLSGEDYNAFVGKDYDPSAALYSDPRVYRGNLSVSNAYDVTRNVYNVGALAVRNFVIDNFTLLTSRAFGLNMGIKPISQGLSLCRLPIGPIADFNTVHPRFNIRVILSESTRRLELGNFNYMDAFKATIIFGGVAREHYVSTPMELRSAMVQMNTNDPIGEIVYERRYVKTSLSEFIKDCVNEKVLVVIIPDIAYAPTFKITSSIRVDNPAPFTSQEVDRLISHHALTLAKVHEYRTGTEVMARVASNITIHTLPLVGSRPIVVYQNLNNPEAAIVTPRMCPIVQPVLSITDEQLVRLGAGVENMSRVAPYSLQTSVIVHYLKPKTAVWLASENV